MLSVQVSHQIAVSTAYSTLFICPSVI